MHFYESNNLKNKKIGPILASNVLQEKSKNLITKMVLKTIFCVTLLFAFYFIISNQFRYIKILN